MWTCSQCKEQCESQFDTCWNCGYEKPGKKIMSESFEETKKETKEIENKTLSEKYVVLNYFQALAFLLMIAATGFFIYSLVQFFDLPKSGRKLLEIAMTTSTVSYFITMFSLFCLTMIINFLFDLDKKTDK
ncbi:MAG: hypothetical protein QGF31_07460 [Nitrospinota bacterium]|jgi:uncharacterized membrane protein YvbJ|nr:hypothetical protein [Nitrospinota bacterium]